MIDLLNVLYVQTQGAYLHLDHDTVQVEIENEVKLRAPLLRLSAIVVFGRVLLSPFLIQRCAADGRAIVWMQQNGRFVGRLAGPLQGNVLLRRAQHETGLSVDRTVRIARQFVAGKLQNTRRLLLRGARDAGFENGVDLRRSADLHATLLVRLKDTSELNSIRAIEGEAARDYFGAMRFLLRGQRDSFVPNGRTRRPPRDRMNAVLSFLYALVRGECVAALEAVGLDPQVGFLHTLRPGRPALALDLMEEFRPVLADRLALTLVNRGQLVDQHFEHSLGGGIALTEDGRRVVIAEYQKRKEDTVVHPLLKQSVPYGLLAHMQARLLARHIRGDIPHYPPYVQR